MNEYTPEMATIRKAYRNSAYTGGGLPELSDAEFDRWLAAHDRAVKAEALREAADEFAARSETFQTTTQSMADSRDYDLSDVTRYAAYSAEANVTATRLRARADQIEGDTDDHA